MIHIIIDCILSIIAIISTVCASMASKAEDAASSRVAEMHMMYQNEHAGKIVAARDAEIRGLRQELEDKRCTACEKDNMLKRLRMKHQVDVRCYNCKQLGPLTQMFAKYMYEAPGSDDESATADCPRPYALIYRCERCVYAEVMCVCDEMMAEKRNESK